MRAIAGSICILLGLACAGRPALAQQPAVLARVALVGDDGLSLRLGTHTHGRDTELGRPCVSPCTIEATPGVHDLRVERPGGGTVLVPGLRLAAGEARLQITYESHETERVVLTGTSIALGMAAIALGVLACVPQDPTTASIEGGTSLGITFVSLTLALLLEVFGDSVRVERV